MPWDDMNSKWIAPSGANSAFFAQYFQIGHEIFSKARPRQVISNQFIPEDKAVPHIPKSCARSNEAAYTEHEHQAVCVSTLVHGIVTLVLLWHIYCTKIILAYNTNWKQGFWVATGVKSRIRSQLRTRKTEQILMAVIPSAEQSGRDGYFYMETVNTMLMNHSEDLKTQVPPIREPIQISPKVVGSRRNLGSRRWQMVLLVAADVGIEQAHREVSPVSKMQPMVEDVIQKNQAAPPKIEM
ncbi:hypothetical protein C8R46DRAFT_1034099 [Mycena filopes]|nr:hypothetical protein C8R46DRAFT_1034099 [Mycena filopes]